MLKKLKLIMWKHNNPYAGSPTKTLLRLFQLLKSDKTENIIETQSAQATGGVYKGQKQIQNNKIKYIY